MKEKGKKNMKIETLLTLTTKEQNQIEDFDHFIKEIFDKRNVARNSKPTTKQKENEVIKE